MSYLQVPLIKERVTLSALKSDMWNAEHDSTIIKFLKDTSVRLLVVYIDKLLGLQVGLSVPPHPVEEMTFMIRFENATLNPDNIERKLQFGTIRANHIESLLRTMTNVYAPLFFGNKSWPDSILFKISLSLLYVLIEHLIRASGGFLESSHSCYRSLTID